MLFLIAMNKKKLGNILFWVFLVLLIIPQSRKTIQIGLNKGLGIFSPSQINEKDQVIINDFNWKLIDENGATVNLEALKGKVIIMNFWATWCPPCIAEMPDLQELFNTFDTEKEISFLFVTSDPFTKTKAFKEKEGFTFPVFRPLETYPRELEHTTIPQTFVIDKSGKIVVDKNGVANWSSEKTIQLINDLLSK